MSNTIPLVVNFKGDYAMKVLVVDTDSTIGDVAEKARDALVGHVVKPLPPGTKLIVRRHEDEVVLDDAIKVADANLMEMEALDIVY